MLSLIQRSMSSHIAFQMQVRGHPILTAGRSRVSGYALSGWLPAVRQQLANLAFSAGDQRLRRWFFKMTSTVSVCLVVLIVLLLSSKISDRTGSGFQEAISRRFVSNIFECITRLKVASSLMTYFY